MSNGFEIDGERVPFGSEYFGPWAMESSRFMAGFESLSRLNLSLHLAQVRAAGGDSSRRGYGFEVTPDGVAIVDLAGTMMKQESSAMASTSTVAMRRTVRQLAADDGIRAAMIRIDSPGGTVAGTAELADDVAALAAKKPTHAFVDDLCASAAYWVGSQCASISAGRTALVGSIGTYVAIQDSSGAAKRDGVKVHVVSSGGVKGAGVPGTEITDEYLAQLQQIIDGLNAHFLNAVSSGRKLSGKTVQELADGRVHVSDQAKALRLIDAVEPFESAMDRLRSAIPGTGRSTARASASQSVVLAVAPPALTGAAAVAEFQRRVAARGAGSGPAVAAADPKLYAACIDACMPTFDPRTEQSPELVRGFGAPGPTVATVARAMLAAMSAGEARIEFERRVAAMRARGVPREKAAGRVFAENPGLQQAMRGTGNTQAGSAAADDDPIRAVDERVATLKAAGWSHSRSVCFVFDSDPALHARYRAACAAQQRQSQQR